jgi:DNA polymerase
MTDPYRLFRRYLRQQEALGEHSLVLNVDDMVRPADLVPKAVASAHSGTPPGDAGRPGPPSPASGSGSATQSATAANDGPKWLKGAPEIPPPGIEVPVPATDLFTGDPLAGKTVEGLAEVIRGCTLCGLCNERTNAVPGEGPSDAALMVIGEGPGAVEDETGRPFVGRAGQLLTDILKAIDCPRESVFIGNIVKCRPPENRNPERDEIASCLPYLHRQIQAISPTVILAVGATAACSLLETRGSLGSLRNKVHRFRGIPVVVTYHPAALLRNPHWKKPTWDDVRIARRLLAGER